MRCIIVFFSVAIASHLQYISGLVRNNSGACNVRNTAYAQATGRWRMPNDSIHCVDITEMGNTTFATRPHFISQATTLYADHMGLDAVPNYAVSAMQHLKLLDLTGNHIRRISKKAFKNNIHLHTLILSDNGIKIPKKSGVVRSASLKSLSLSNNKIKKLWPLTFRGVPALTVLFLDRNEIVKLSPEVFKPLTKLKYLHLGGNKLRVRPHKIVPPSVTTLIVKGNFFNKTKSHK